MTPDQRALLEDKLALWRQASEQGNMGSRDYNRRCADALEAALAPIPAQPDTTALREAAQVAADAWTPERSIRIFLTPGGVSIDGTIINRDEKQQYRSSRLCAYEALHMGERNWLITLIEQVKSDLALRAGKTIWSATLSPETPDA